MKLSALILGISLFFAGTAFAADKAAADKAIAEAKAALDAATSAKVQWRDTGKMIEKAEKAAGAGDFAKAKKVADEATFQSKTAMDQGKGQANVGNPSYLY